MDCPNCRRIMEVKHFDNQTILHCSNCGGSYFAENGINRITLKTAKFLTLDKKNDEVSGDKKTCPREGNVMVPVHGESVPNDVTILSCSVCKSIFVFPDDLLSFKKAQEAKTNYYKTWKIPLPSVRSIAVLMFFMLTVTTLVASFISLRPSPTRLKAEDTVTDVHFTASTRYLFIFFKTTTLLKSEIEFKDMDENTSIVKQVNAIPGLTHQLTTGDINVNHLLYYRIILTDEKGTKIETEFKKVELK